MAQRLQGTGHVRRRQRGFTLIELMIVVVIVAVLSTLAVLGYRKLVQSSHVSEATTMVSNIRVAQEAYHAETQGYANMSQDLTTPANMYPAKPVYGILTAWGASCAGICNTGMDWTQLPLHVDGPVLFGYSTIAGAAKATAVAVGNNCGITGLQSPLTDWYVVAAEADLDGVASTTTDVCAFSWSNQIVVYNEGL